jgi:hypothetical protein
MVVFSACNRQISGDHADIFGREDSRKAMLNFCQNDKRSDINTRFISYSGRFPHVRTRLKPRHMAVMPILLWDSTPYQ